MDAPMALWHTFLNGLKPDTSTIIISLDNVHKIEFNHLLCCSFSFRVHLSYILCMHYSSMRVTRPTADIIPVL